MDIEDTRGLELSTLTNWIDQSKSRSGVSLIGISGYGGIGKTYLLNEALRQSPAADSGYCEIRVDGSDREQTRDFMKLLNTGLSPIKLPGGAIGKDYFLQVRKLEKAHAALLRDVEQETSKMEISEGVKTAMDFILTTGTFLNKAIPASRDWLDTEVLRALEIEDKVDDAIELIGNLESLNTVSFLPGPISDLLGVTYKRRIREDFFELAADSYVGDLSAAIVKNRQKDWFKMDQGSVKGLEGLLLIIDDFEILGKSTAEFLVANLIPHLQHASFPTTIIFLGRDDMKDVHVGFPHHHADKIVGALRLETLPLETAKALLMEHDYSPEEAANLAEETEGYPFLISILCESKDRSVVFYQRFFDRTTRWMSRYEKEWVIPLAYLDKIDKEILSRMLPEESPAMIMEWFQREASIRDPNGTFYAISPFIRKMMCEYNLRIEGAGAHEELLRRANEAVYPS